MPPIYHPAWSKMMAGIGSTGTTKPRRVRFVPPLGGHGFDGGEHSRAGMTTLVLEELLIRRRNRHFVVEPKLRRGTERRQIFHRRTENPDMGGMRLRPALERREAAPPALPVGFLGGHAVRAEHAHIAVGVAADCRTLVAQ